MKSRLAFSIACLVEPDILILDEVLSVGDGAFRKKSESKMKEILKSGVTGVLVSHSIDQIRSMCNKILWLDKGKQICFSTDTKTVCDAYEEFLITKRVPYQEKEIVQMSNAYKERQSKTRAEEEKSEEEKLLDILKKSNQKSAAGAAKKYLEEMI